MKLLLFNIVLKSSGQYNQAKKINIIQTEKEEIKLSLFTDNRIVYKGKLKKSAKEKTKQNKKTTYLN